MSKAVILKNEPASLKIYIFFGKNVVAVLKLSDILRQKNELKICRKNDIFGEPLMLVPFFQKNHLT